jgi:CheY-like chemotaxis protein
MQRTAKLDALGILAGGIAHDFNNLMGGVFGYIDMVCAMSQDEMTITYCTKAMSAIDRARSLTQQLLTFSKGGAPVKKVANLFPFVEETVQFALSGSNINCTWKVGENLPPCDYDKNQMNQVINNIIINAQQAMPHGGTISITAEPVIFSTENHLSLPHGNYVMLEITDSGDGISEENISRIFDPFFTTKNNAHGLGLSTCHSIIARHGGAIDVRSSAGNGSTFSIYLPAEQETPDHGDDTTFISFRGHGVFIVLEDEAIMRDIIIAMLKSFGFDVIFTMEGEETIQQYNRQIQEKKNVAGMIFDLTIPGGMGGRETIRELRKLSSDVPVFVASGYAADPVMSHPEEYGFTDSICKPFRKTDLAAMLLKHFS